MESESVKHDRVHDLVISVSISVCIANTLYYAISLMFCPHRTTVGRALSDKVSGSFHIYVQEYVCGVF